MEKHNDIRPSVEIRQAQREAAEKIAAAQERGDLVAAKSALNEFSEQMRAFREHFGSITEALGQNFLGLTAWQNIGVDVGETPPLPKSLTLEVLNSDCPLHPGEKIKDTHLLVLIPKTVDGELYTALKLDELCATMKGSAEKLIWDGTGWATSWQKQAWASAPQSSSEWVVIPKSDPDPKEVLKDKHFRSKSVASQQKVHTKHYGEYREVKALELMTAVLLYDLTHKERLLPNYFLRCEEPNASGGRVCVGCFFANGLRVNGDYDDNDCIGRALARKL